MGKGIFLNGCSKEWNLDPGTGKRDREMERIRVTVVIINIAI